MPKRSNEFQKLIAFIEKELAESGVKVTESAELEEYEDSSKREVDVLIEAQINNHPIRIAIECRDHSRPQNKTWIDALIGKYRDIEVSRVVAVSKSGFTRGAREKANAVGISTLTLRQAYDSEWPDEFIKTYAKFIAQKHSRKTFSIEYEKGNGPTFNSQEELDAVSVVKENGETEGTLREVLVGLYEMDGRWAINQSIEDNLEELIADAEDKFVEFDIPYQVTGRTLIGGGGTQHKIDSIILHIGCELSFLPAKEERYFYNRTQVTISSLETESEKISIGSVQIPDAEEDIKIAFKSRTPTQ